MDELIKRDYIIILYDAYKGLLTTKQQDYFELYYFHDLSLSEIADEFQISRNAVFDQIKKTIAILKHYEDVLKNIDKLERIKQLKQDDTFYQKVINILEE